MMMMFGVYLFVLINFIYVCSSAEDQINVFGKKLEQCSVSPMTGYYRTGKMIDRWMSIFLFHRI